MIDKSSADILTYLITENKIDINEVCNQLEMKKYDELLSKHEYKIWQGNNGSWYTYLPAQENGRILKKRSTEKAIQDLVVRFYKTKLENPTIKELFDEWITQKLEYREIQKGSADRYQTDFNRFFIKTKFAQRHIRQIDEEILEEFIRVQIRDNNLSQKSYSGLRILIRGIWMYAKKKKLTTISISTFFGDLDISRRCFTKKVKEKEEEVFSETEVPIIMKYLKTNQSIWDLGVALVLETGLRVGELSALKHSDWDGGNILKVRRTEIRQKNKQGRNTVLIREFTKTEAGMRDVILSQSGIETLNMISKINPSGEFLFENANGKRIRGNTFNKHLDTVLKNLNLPHRSIHKGRKTYGTTLIDAGCEDSLVMNQLGHTSIETSRKYYYYSNRTRSHQISQIEQAITI